MASFWAEGVQLEGVGPGTHVVVHDGVALVLDGGTPDRFVKVDGRWLLAELPRNRRHRVQGEACETAISLPQTLLSSPAAPINPKSELGCVAETES